MKRSMVGLLAIILLSFSACSDEDNPMKSSPSPTLVRIKVVDTLGNAVEGIRVGSINHWYFTQAQAARPKPNPSTLISFSIPEAGDVELKILNYYRELVRTLMDRHSEAGQLDVDWDGTDSTGNPVPSGYYYYQLRATSDSNPEDVFTDEKVMVLEKGPDPDQTLIGVTDKNGLFTTSDTLLFPGLLGDPPQVVWDGGAGPTSYFYYRDTVTITLSDPAHPDVFLHFDQLLKTEPNSFELTWDPTGADFVYPLDIGNQWEYSGEWFFFNFDPDSLGDQYGDTMHFRTTVEITGQATLFDTLETFVFHETLLELDPPDTFHSENHFNNRPDGFYNYAYEGMGVKATPLKPAHGQFIHFKGRYFRTVREVFDWLEQAVGTLSCAADTLIYEDPPVRCLAYPLTLGAQWTFRQTGDPWRMDKRIIDWGSRSTPAGSFDCYTIRWFYDIGDDGVWDEDIDVIDNIAAIGLVSRSITVRGIQIMDYSSPEPIGTFDAKEEYVLTDYQQ